MFTVQLFGLQYLKKLINILSLFSPLDLVQLTVNLGVKTMSHITLKVRCSVVSTFDCLLTIELSVLRSYKALVTPLVSSNIS